jgi:alpha-tubulin suppressor-like RCC1 family protein
MLPCCHAHRSWDTLASMLVDRSSLAKCGLCGLALALVSCSHGGCGAPTPAPAPSSSSVSVSKAAPDPTEVVDVGAGTDHACRLYRSGRVSCWGGNASGQLGNRTRRDRPRPALVEGVNDAVSIALHHDASCAVRRGGEVVCWGRHPAWASERLEPSPLGELRDVERFALSKNRWIALLRSGEVVTDHGPTSASRGRRVTASMEHGCVLGLDAAVQCFALGTSSPWPKEAVRVEGLDDRGILEISSGFLGGCGIARDNALVCWDAPGDKHYGHDGSPTGLPTVRAGPIPKARFVAVGDGHACAIAEDGRVACWGLNGAGQLGSPFEPQENMVGRWDPVWVDGLSDAVRIAVGAKTTCALRRGGRVVCWGFNEHGQVGNGSTAIFPDPVPVQGLKNVNQLVSTASETFALTEAGKLLSWGGRPMNSGRVDDLSSRVREEAIEDVRQVAAAPGEICVVTGAGEVKCRTVASLHFDKGDWESVSGLADVAALQGTEPGWSKPDGGHSSSDELWYALHGSGSVSVWLTTKDRSRKAIRVQGVRDAASVGVGMDHACSVRKNGRVECWHHRSVVTALERGQGVAVPRRVSIPDMDAKATAGSCILRKSGRLACYSMDIAGSRLEPGSSFDVEGVAEVRQLYTTTCLLRGGGTLECFDTYKDARTLTLEGVVDVAVGAWHGCALMKDRQVQCWGDNGKGAVGQPGAPIVSAPVEVLPDP